MRKFLKGLGISALVMLPVMAGAVSYDDPDYTYDYGNTDYSYTTDDTIIDDGAAAALGVGFLIFGLISGLIGLVGFVFWLVMFIDCIKRDFDQKVLWLVLMFFLGFLPAVFYYFMIKKKNVTGTAHKVVVTNTTTSSTVTTPPAADVK